MSVTFEDSPTDPGENPSAEPKNGVFTYENIGAASLIGPGALAIALALTTDMVTAGLLPGMLTGVGIYAAKRGQQAREEGKPFFSALNNKADHRESKKISVVFAAAMIVFGAYVAKNVETGDKQEAFAKTLPTAPAPLDQRVDCTGSDGSRIRGVMVATTPDGQSFRIDCKPY